MPAPVSELWPWIVIVGLGAFHGANPAMGWLFAVALGMHRHSRRVVAVSLAPIALGHAISIWAVAAVVLLLGVVIDVHIVQLASGAALLGWASYHWIYGHRRRVAIGMQTGLAGLALWSFLMATAHGAGLMLLPAVMPLCLGAAATGTDSLTLSLAAVALHTLSMLAVTGLIALVVFEWLGLAFLRRGWINFDLLWSLALAATGTLLLVT